MKQSYVSRIEKKRFWVRRVVLILAILLLVAIATVMLGLLLKSRSELISTISQTPEETSAKQPSVMNHDNNTSSLHLNAGTIDIRSGTTAEVKRQVDALPFAGYDSLSIQLTGADGKLLYASPSIAAVTRTDKTGVPMENIQTATTAATMRYLRSSAVISVGSFFTDTATAEAAASLDGLIVREIESLGFSEVILTDAPFYDEFTEEGFKLFRTYLSTLRRNAPSIDIGVAFLPAVYTNEASLKNLNMLSLYADFLALDVRQNKSTFAAEQATDLSQAYSLYSLRTLLTSGDVQAPAIRTALASAGCKNFQYVR